MATQIPLAKIEEMFAAYCEVPSAAHIARKCSVAHQTAQKYVGEGDPVRGIEPFVQRIRRVTRLAARRVEKKIAYRKADAHAAAWEHLQLLDDSILEALLNIRENMDDRKPKLHEVAKAVEISVKLKTALQQWAEDDAGKHDAEEFFAGWSEEEVQIFIEQGQLPSRAIVPESLVAPADDSTPDDPRQGCAGEVPQGPERSAARSSPVAASARRPDDFSDTDDSDSIDVEVEELQPDDIFSPSDLQDNDELRRALDFSGAKPKPKRSHAPSAGTDFRLARRVAKQVKPTVYPYDEHLAKPGWLAQNTEGPEQDGGSNGRRRLINTGTGTETTGKTNGNRTGKRTELPEADTRRQRPKDAERAAKDRTPGATGGTPGATDGGGENMGRGGEHNRVSLEPQRRPPQLPSGGRPMPAPMASRRRFRWHGSQAALDGPHGVSIRRGGR